MKDKKQKNESEQEDVIEASETVNIEPGKHTGHITNMIREIRGEEKYDYVDIYVTFDDKNLPDDTSIKFGFPTVISEKSGFGKFLELAGMGFKPKDQLSLKDIKKQLIGRTLEFQTITEGDFARVVAKTIKFIN